MKTLVPWFGSNRTLAENVGRALTCCKWIGVPFAGGMSEIRHLNARTILVSDLHSHVLNLAAVVADRELNGQLRERLDSLPYHPHVLKAAQQRCIKRESRGAGTIPDLEWAVDYFICSWQSRASCAGTKREFSAPFSIRWGLGQGSGRTFRLAIEGLSEWQEVMKRCDFVVMDAFAVLDRVKDEPKHALYCDPPFITAKRGEKHGIHRGTAYKFGFTLADHKELARRLTRFENCRVVCRFYDHPAIRELYSQGAWEWNEFEGKRQTNQAGSEVLLIKRQ